jgi:predicted transcriptional regulator
MADFKYKGKKKLKFDPKKLKSLLAKNLTGKEVAKLVGISEATLYRYTKHLKENKELVGHVADSELTDLTLLGAKARMRLEEKIMTMNPIELIALMDRSFQQRRLLEGKSTQNVSILTSIINEAHEQLKSKLGKK